MTQNDRLLLNAYIDGELDPAHVLEFERRLAEDRPLADERNRIEALRGAMRERLPRATASPELRRRVAAVARPRRFAVGLGGRRGFGKNAAPVVGAFSVGRSAPPPGVPGGPGGAEVSGSKPNRGPV